MVCELCLVLVLLSICSLQFSKFFGWCYLCLDFRVTCFFRLDVFWFCLLRLDAFWRYVLAFWFWISFRCIVVCWLLCYVVLVLWVLLWYFLFGWFFGSVTIGFLG